MHRIHLNMSQVDLLNSNRRYQPPRWVTSLMGDAKTWHSDSEMSSAGVRHAVFIIRANKPGMPEFIRLIPVVKLLDDVQDVVCSRSWYRKTAWFWVRWSIMGHGSWVRPRSYLARWCSAALYLGSQSFLPKVQKFKITLKAWTLGKMNHLVL